MINGFDSSQWDWTLTDGITGGKYYVPISYDVAYRNGSRYCFLKACDGTNDTAFYTEAIRDARAAGLLAAPYVWLHGRNWYDPRKQGEHWLAKLGNEPLIVIDFESYLDSIPTFDDLYNAIEAMRAGGYAGKIMIYTGHWYWLAHGSTADYWKQFPVWLARYYTEPPQPTPPWDTWTFWQFSATGDPAKYGITNGKKAVDENRFEGTQAELEAIFGGAITPPPPQEETMKIYRAKVSLNVRNAPSTAATVIGSLPVNGMYSVSDVSLNWGKIVEMFDANGVKISLPAAECWISTKPEYAVLYPFTLPTGGQGLPDITFNLSADGYPAQVVTWTPS